MPVKLSTLLNQLKPARVEIEIGEQKETLNFKFRPYSPLIVHQIEKAALADRATNSDVEALLLLVAEWNLHSDDGELLPVNRENIEALPHDIIISMWQQIFNPATPTANA